MKKFIISLILVLITITFVSLSGCAISKHGISMKEMSSKPTLIIQHDTLIAKLRVIEKHSALCTYKMNILVDKSQREIYLTAYRALVRTNNSRDIVGLLLYPFTRPCKHTFHIKLSKNKVAEPNSFEYFWIDPDKTITKLEITSCSTHKEN